MILLKKYLEYLIECLNKRALNFYKFFIYKLKLKVFFDQTFPLPTPVL